MTIFWIGCTLAAPALLAAWIANSRSGRADKPEDARLLEIKAAIARWEEAGEQARERDAAADRLWEVMRPQTATRL